MATIRARKTKRGETRYFAEIRLKGHRPARQSFRTKTAAKTWAQQIEGEIRSGRYLPRLEASRHTVSDALDRYFEDNLGDLGSHRDRRDRRSHLEWWRRQIGHLTLADLSPAVISDARRDLLRAVSGATSNRYLAALSAVLQLSVREWMWLDRNPVRQVRRKRESRGRVRILRDGERARLLEACRESRDRRLYPLVLFALTTGARQGELLGLRWEDVDLVGSRATLNKTKNSDRRVLSFPGTAREVLREMSQTPHISGYVFAGPRTRGHPRFPQKAWEDARRAAQIDDFRFHDLRHTAASYLAMSGATLPELAAFLGHRTLEMVKRYAHLTESHTETVAARMVEKFRL